MVDSAVMDSNNFYKGNFGFELEKDFYFRQSFCYCMDHYNYNSCYTIDNFSEEYSIDNCSNSGH